MGSDFSYHSIVNDSYLVRVDHSRQTMRDQNTCPSLSGAIQCFLYQLKIKQVSNCPVVYCT